MNLSLKNLIKDKLFLDVKEQFEKDNVFLILTDPKYERYHTRALYHIFKDEQIIKSFLEQFTKIKINSFEINSIKSEKIADDKSNIKDIFFDVYINNEKYELIFEIKLDSILTSNQVEKYINEVEKKIKESKIKGYYGFYIRLGEEISEKNNFTKVTRKELIQFLKKFEYKSFINNYIKYLELFDIITEIGNNYYLSKDISSNIISYKDRCIIDYLKQFLYGKSATKSKGRKFFNEACEYFKNKLDELGYQQLDIKSSESVHNPTLVLWDKSWKKIEEEFNIRLHYEFQKKGDCLKIHMEVPKHKSETEAVEAVKRRRKLFPEIQKYLKDNDILGNYGLETENRLNDNKSCNQLCKFSNVIIDDQFDKNKLLEKIIEINKIVSEVIKEIFLNGKFVWGGLAMPIVNWWWV